MTITREIREKVIQLSKDHGRNEIARLINGQGLHISEGSVGNIIRAYHKSLQLSQQLIQKKSSCIDIVNTSQSSQGPETDATISTGINMNYTGSPVSVSGRPGVGLTNVVIHRDGGPLSRFLNESVVNPDSIYYKGTTPPAPIKPSRDLLIKDPELNIEPDDTINQDVNMKIETVKEEKVEQHQSRSSLSNTQNPEPQITWDPDSDDSWDRNFFKRVMDQRRLNIHELQLIENGKRELEEERQQIELMKQSVRQQMNDLKAREDKLNQTLNEIKPLLPSVRELQNVGITFDLVLPYMMAINEKSALENIDLKTAAYNIVRDFREYRSLGGLRRVIEKAEKQLSALGNTIRENQKAIASMTKLQAMGYTKRDIAGLMRLMGIPGNGHGYRKLDDKLIKDRTQLGNNVNLLQHPGSSNPGPGSNMNPQQQQNNVKNGYGSNFSMNDWIRLNLLKSNTTNMLNKISGKNAFFIVA